jgi:hypothetical protein
MTAPTQTWSSRAKGMVYDAAPRAKAGRASVVVVHLSLDRHADYILARPGRASDYTEFHVEAFA